MEENSGEKTWSDCVCIANLPNSQRSVPFSSTKTCFLLFISKLVRTGGNFRTSARVLHSHVGFALKKIYLNKMETPKETTLSSFEF